VICYEDCMCIQFQVKSFLFLSKEATFCFLFICRFLFTRNYKFQDIVSIFWRCKMLLPTRGKSKEIIHFAGKKKPATQSHVNARATSGPARHQTRGWRNYPLRLPRDNDACRRRSSAVAVGGGGVGPSTRCTSLDLFNNCNTHPPTHSPTPLPLI
jgi:hypothetical protein